MTIHTNPITVSLAAMLVAVACMVPPASQGNTAASPGAEPTYAEGGGGGATCGDYCGHLRECGILEMYGASDDDCAMECDTNLRDGAQAAVDEVVSTDCGTLQAGNSGGGGGGGGVYVGGGGTGQGCAMSSASSPVQDCPSGQECCGSRCWTQGKCAMPTGN